MVSMDFVVIYYTVKGRKKEYFSVLGYQVFVLWTNSKCTHNQFLDVSKDIVPVLDFQNTKTLGSLHETYWFVRVTFRTTASHSYLAET